MLPAAGKDRSGFFSDADPNGEATNALSGAAGRALRCGLCALAAPLACQAAPACAATPRRPLHFSFIDLLPLLLCLQPRCIL